MTTIVVATSSVTRPANVIPYTIGDLVANNTAAASVVPLTFNVGPYQSLFLRKARLVKSSLSLTGASFRLHFFTSPPAFITSGDNGATFSTTTPLITGVDGYIGALDVTMDRVFTDGVAGISLPVLGSELSFASGQGILYAAIEAKGAYTPVSEEVFKVTIEAHRY